MRGRQAKHLGTSERKEEAKLTWIHGRNKRTLSTPTFCPIFSFRYRTVSDTVTAPEPITTTTCSASALVPAAVRPHPIRPTLAKPSGSLAQFSTPLQRHHRQTNTGAGHTGSAVVGEHAVLAPRDLVDLVLVLLHDSRHCRMEGIRRLLALEEYIRALPVTHQ